MAHADRGSPSAGAPRSSARRRIVPMLLYATTYFAVARASLWPVLAPEGLTAVWPLSGLALGALLLCRRCECWGYLTATFAAGTVAHVSSGTAWLPSLAFAAVNSLEPLLGAWVLRRIAGAEVTFTTLRQVLSLAVAASVPTGATAPIRAAVAAATFGANYGVAWFTWWLASGLGILLVTPLIVAWATAGRALPATARRRQIEAAALTVLVLVICWAVFGTAANLGSSLRRPYWAIPMLLWAAFRFPQRGNATVLVTVAAFAVGGLACGTGPFFCSGEWFHQQVLSMQMYLATMALSMYTVAALWSERRAFEARLCQSEQALHQAQRVARVGSWAWHLRNNRLEWSDGMYRIFGLDPAAFSADLNDVVARSIHPEDRAAVEQSNLSVSRDGRPVPLEYRIVRPDGSIRVVWAEAGMLHRDETGAPAVLTGIVQDITERKLAHDALMESERLARATVDALPAHLAIVDGTGTVVAVNRAWREFAAANGGHAAAVGEGVNYLTVCETATDAEAASAAAFAAGIRFVLAGTVREYAQEYACHSGTTQRWFLGRVTRFPDDGPTRLVVTHEDVTDRRRSADALRESQERFAKVFYRSPALITISHLEDGRLVDVNDQFCAVSGFARDEAIGRTTVELGWLTPARRQAGIAHLGPDGTARGVELACQSKSGGTVHCVCHGEVIAIGGERLLLSLGLDVTEQRRANAELEQQRLRAVHVDRLQALGEMATSIAHELNQPLNGIRTFAEGLLLGPQMGWSPTPEETIQALEDIVAQVDRMGGIIDHMRAFARAENASDATQFHLGDCVTGALQLLGTQLRVHGIAVRRESADGSPACHGWPHAIEQVLLNLIGNARDALDDRLRRQRAGDPSTGPDWCPMIDIGAAVGPDGRTTALSVADNGGGIDGDVLPRIFDPFYTTKSVGKGTGLGLSISRAILERHHGTITVDNRPGDGATFTITLPVAEPLEGGSRPAQPGPSGPA